jgi:hypothetical protein
VGCVVCNAPETEMLAVPTFTDPVIPGDVVGNDPPLPAIVVPVASVTPVADVGDVAAGEVLPVGDASGGGPSDSRSFPPPQATSGTSADVITIMRFRRTRAPFAIADCNPAVRDIDRVRESPDGVVA